ncbi:MAG TPA: hypothetical protein VGA56_20085 [Opitutaceae bacterium]
MYDYLEADDTDLPTFSVAPDESHRLPFIRRAIDAAGGSLRIFASPWSPPAWMKDNGDRLNGGRLLPNYHQSWADYFVKFIEAYEARGIPIWGLNAILRRFP